MSRAILCGRIGGSAHLVTGRIRAEETSALLFSSRRLHTRFDCDWSSDVCSSDLGLIVQLTPSMAVTMLDALPYLIDYPYGCTEQTMSRFLPAAITAKTLRDLGLQPEDVVGDRKSVV